MRKGTEIQPETRPWRGKRGELEHDLARGGDVAPGTDRDNANCGRAE